MEALQKLTPEQIQSLMPESLLLILNNHEKMKDIEKLKWYFQTSNNNSCYGHNGYSAFEIKEMRRILEKYNQEKFYITFEFKGKIRHNFQIYTIDEIVKLLPTGLDLAKVCFTVTNRPVNFVDYPPPPQDLNMAAKDPKLAIEWWSLFHPNLYYVHPILLTAANYFLKDI